MVSCFPCSLLLSKTLVKHSLLDSEASGRCFRFRETPLGLSLIAVHEIRQHPAFAFFPWSALLSSLSYILLAWVTGKRLPGVGTEPCLGRLALDKLELQAAGALAASQVFLLRLEHMAPGLHVKHAHAVKASTWSFQLWDSGSLSALSWRGSKSLPHGVRIRLQLILYSVLTFVQRYRRGTETESFQVTATHYVMCWGSLEGSGDNSVSGFFSVWVLERKGRIAGSTAILCS